MFFIDLKRKKKKHIIECQRGKKYDGKWGNSVVMPIKEKMTKKQLKWFGYMQRSLEEIIIIGDLTEINVP